MMCGVCSLCMREKYCVLAQYFFFILSASRAGVGVRGGCSRSLWLNNIPFLNALLQIERNNSITKFPEDAIDNSSCSLEKEH